MTEAAKAEQEAAAISKSSKANMERATNEAIKSLASFGKALTSGADGGFSKFSDGLNSASGAVVALSKNFGILGTVLGTIVQVGTKVITMQLKQADDALKASDEIKKLGNAGALSTKQVMEMVHNSGLSIEQSKKFTDAMKKAGSGVIGLGDKFGDGAVAFGQMVAVTNTQREGFQRLGISQEELMGYQGEYLALQKASGMQMSKQGKDGEALKKASLDYTRNLVELSNISGNDITTAKKNMEAERSRYEVMIDTARINREINAAEKSGNTEKADMLKKELASRNALIDASSQYLDEDSKAGLAQFLATGAITDASKQFANAGVDMDSFRRRIKSGENGEKVAADFSEAMKKATNQALESVGTAALYDKSVGKNFLINEKLIAHSQGRLGINERELAQSSKAATDAVLNGTKEDTAENLRNKATTAAIVTTVKFDEILEATNPILSGFNKGLGLATIALTALAGAAVVALAAKGGGKAISSGAKALKGVFGKGAPALPGAGPGKLPGATTVADGAAKASAAKAAEEAAKASAAKAAESAAKSAAGAAAEGAAKTVGAAEAAAKAGAGAAAESATKAGAGAATVATGEAALKTAGATAGKAMLKSLPVIGSLLSVYSAYGKISSGDYMGAALEGGAAVAALVPGPGTAIALALTGASGARDVYTALNPDLAKVPESVPAEPPKSVAKPTAPEVPKQVQAPGEAGRGGAAPAAPAAAAPAAAAPAAAAPASTASTAAGTMGAYKSRAAAPAAAAPAAAAPAAAAPAAAAPAAAAPAAAAPTSTASTAAGTMGAYKSRAASPDTASMASAGPISDVSKLLVFGGNSGTLETFKGLDSGLQKAVTSAAEEYNKSTGQKIKVNSAKRDSADQKRLWDESVEAGRPGWGPKGMQIARPGTSKHERGAAIDIQQYNDPVAVGLMNKYGMKQTVMPKDPVHFELKAKKGGMFNGPESGYPVEMHGNEIITPLSPNSILEQLGKTPATTEIAGSSSSSTTNTIKEIYSMNTEIMELLAGKLDTMISKLSDSNDTQSKLLMYSRV
jgi:hypothetical protein